jgi:hypothetical protein
VNGKARVLGMLYSSWVLNDSQLSVYVRYMHTKNVIEMVRG